MVDRDDKNGSGNKIRRTDSAERGGGRDESGAGGAGQAGEKRATDAKRVAGSELHEEEDRCYRAGLSTRQCEVIRLLADGLTIKEAARELGISPKTAAIHAMAVRVKLGAKNTANAVYLATKRGILLLLIASSISIPGHDTSYRRLTKGRTRPARVGRLVHGKRELPDK